MGGIYFGGGFFAEYSVGIPSTGTHTSVHFENEGDSGATLTNVQGQGATVQDCAVGEPTITGLTGV